jgi:hypothetical protein
MSSLLQTNVRVSRDASMARIAAERASPGVVPPPTPRIVASERSTALHRRPQL